jgi:hypothetical protein
MQGWPYVEPMFYRFRFAGAQPSFRAAASNVNLNRAAEIKLIQTNSK